MLKKSKGITLIALVVTIIVLLILAGVTLSFVAGENGILKRATDVVDINEKASAEEQANLLLTELGIKYYEEKYVKRTEGLTTQDDYIKKQLGEEKVTDTGEYVVKIEGEEVIVLKDGNEISKGTLNNGKVNWTGETTTIPESKKPLFSQITADNYGDKVNYSITVNNVVLDNWKIFYNNENIVTMIYGDYLPNSTGLSSNAGLNCLYSYSVYSSNLVTTLQTSTAWEALLTEELKNKGATAKGAVDLEMWVSSWNANEGYTPIFTAQDSAGYYVGLDENPTGTNVELKNNIGYQNKLYFPHQENMDGALGYWLSSPSAGYFTWVLMIGCPNGCIGNGDYGYDYSSVRPVISLPSSILGKQLEDNSWDIE